MSWGTTDSAHKLGDKQRVVKQVVTFTDGRTGTVIGSQERRDVLVTETWVGISATAADTYFGSHGTDENLQDLSIEPMNDAGAFVVVRSILTPGTWA